MYTLSQWTEIIIHVRWAGKKEGKAIEELLNNSSNVKNAKSKHDERKRAVERNCFEMIKANLHDDSFFAMSYEDDLIIKNAFRDATPNPMATEFPDYLFQGGIIEHFQVTSSFQGRKGSTMARENVNLDRDLNKRIEEANNNAAEGQLTFSPVETPMIWHKTHSYENFVSSFKTNVKEHIDSLEKYTGTKGNVIFMIEYTDAALCMSKRYASDLMQNVSYGDLLVDEKPAYRLSRDIELLRYIHEFRDKLDYVIFLNNSFHGIFIDVIKTSNALEIVKLLHEGYDFYCAMVATSKMGIGINYPME